MGNKFKVILVGDSKTGKSCLLQRYIYDEFNSKKCSTIGVDYSSKTILVDETQVTLQIWDTAGQERFRSIIKTYYFLADAVLLCFDVADKETFDNLKKWLSEIDEYCKEKTIKFIIGTKNDLYERIVSKEIAMNFSRSRSIPYIEISSKNMNSKELEEKLFRIIAEKLHELEPKTDVKRKKLYLPHGKNQNSNGSYDNLCCSII